MSVNAAVPRNGWKKCLGAGLGIAVIFVGEIAGLLFSEVFGADFDLAVTVGGAIAGVVMIIVLGGKSHLRLSFADIAESFKFMWWIVLLSFLLMIWDISDYVASGVTIAPNALAACFESFVLCLAIGIGEETEFRGLITGGILAKSGGSKRGIWGAILVGALIFGAAHVDWTGLDYGDIYSIIQAGFKILQTGMYAVMLSAVMIKTRSLIGIALVHAIDDYLLFVSSGLFGEDLTVEYVTTSSVEDAIATIVFYAIICALYLPTFIKAVRYIKKNVNAPEFGPFINEPDLTAAQAVGAAAYAPAVAASSNPVQPSYGYEWQTGTNQQTLSRGFAQQPPYGQDQGVSFPQPYQQTGQQVVDPGQQAAYPQQPYQQGVPQQITLPQQPYQQTGQQAAHPQQLSQPTTYQLQPYQQGAPQQITLPQQPAGQQAAYPQPQQPYQQAANPGQQVVYPQRLDQQPTFPQQSPYAQQPTIQQSPNSQQGWYPQQGQVDDGRPPKPFGF